MNALMDKFPQDLVILGFPCNQFGKQEPGANDEEIMNGVKYVRPGNNLVPKMEMFQKIDVNGPEAHELYQWLRSRCDPPELTFQSKEKLFYEGLHTHDIRWNWEKFLLDHRGNPFKRYAPSVKPNETLFMDDLQELIQNRRDNIALATTKNIRRALNRELVNNG